MPDGKETAKEHGNPSGFPNTLRLNSVVLRVSELCVAATAFTPETPVPHGFALIELVKSLSRERQVEICGDDSRTWFMTPKFLGMLRPDREGFTPYFTAWNDCFPWEVKKEGLVFFTPGDCSLNWSRTVRLENFMARIRQAPHMISRCLVVQQGLLWTALADPSRTMVKLLYCPLEDEMLQERVMGVMMALVHLVAWHLYGLVECPPLFALSSISEFQVESKWAAVLVHYRFLLMHPGATPVMDSMVKPWLHEVPSKLMAASRPP